MIYQNNERIITVITVKSRVRGLVLSVSLQREPYLGAPHKQYRKILRKKGIKSIKYNKIHQSNKRTNIAVNQWSEAKFK